MSAASESSCRTVLSHSEQSSECQVGCRGVHVRQDTSSEECRPLCIRVPVCVFVFMCLCVCVYMYECVYMFNVCLCVHVCVYVFVYVCMSMSVFRPHTVMCLVVNVKCLP